MNLAHDEKDAKGDTARLEWLMLTLAGSTLRGLIGPASNTGDIEEFRRLIDTRRAQKYCDRCGYLFEQLRRTTAPTKYKGCDVCSGCHAEIELPSPTPTLADHYSKPDTGPSSDGFPYG